MAVISLRLNGNEEKMMSFLTDYYEQDKSALIKFSLKELYEDIIDKQFIADYETKEKSGEIQFVDSTEIINAISR